MTKSLCKIVRCVEVKKFFFVETIDKYGEIIIPSSQALDEAMIFNFFLMDRESKVFRTDSAFFRLQTTDSKIEPYFIRAK